MGISTDTLITVIFLGICFASLCVYYHKRILGDAVRDLYSAGATSAESAKTLEQLGYTALGTVILSHSLSKNGSLRRYVEAVGEKEAPAEEPLSFIGVGNSGTVGYYLPNEKCKEALHRYDSRGTSFAAVLIGIVLFAAAAFAASAIIPLLQGMASGVPESFKLRSEPVGTVVSSVSVTP